MTTNAHRAPAWDEEAVVEAVARALFQRTYPGSTAWDTLPVDEFGKEVWRESAKGLLAVVREHLPTKPDREAVRLAQHQALMPQAMSIFAAVGGAQADYDALLDTLADAVLDLWPGRHADRLAAEGGADRG